MKVQYITAEEVSKTLGISKSKAYKIVRQLNTELKEDGYITIAGKCSLKYFQEKFYAYDII